MHWSPLSVISLGCCIFLAGCSNSGSIELAQVKSELTQVKGELTQVKGELTQVKDELTRVKGELTKLWSEINDMPFPRDQLKAKLVATKTTFTLDLAGLTSADYKRALVENDHGKLPPTPTVTMALELTNTSNKDVHVWIGGVEDLIMELKGPGAVLAPWRSQNKLGPRAVPPQLEPILLAPGKSHSLSISYLFDRREGNSWGSHWYWTEPGDYTLSASLTTALNASPKGVKPNKDGFRKVTIPSEPLSIRVERKE